MIPKEILGQIPAEPEAQRLWFEENFKHVTIPTKLELIGVSPDDNLLRFIDLPKLFDLIKNQHLFLPRLRQLIQGDPFECFCQKNYDHLNRDELESLAQQLELYAPDEAKGTIYPPEIINVWQHIYHGKPRFDSEIQAMTIADLKKAVWYLERERLKCDLVCCCWYKGANESDAMWKIYARQLGVMIATSPAKIESATKLVLAKIWAERIKLKLAAVHYEDTEESGSHEPWLIKRMAFKHEEEVRLYCDYPWIEIEVSLPDLIDEIVITPFAEEWEIKSVKAAIEALLKEVGASGIRVRQSDHMRGPKISWPEQHKTLGNEPFRPSLSSVFRQIARD